MLRPISDNGRERSDRLSVCCVTDASPARVAAVLEPLRGCAEEIVIGVDERCRDDISRYATLADHVTIVPTAPVEHNLARIFAMCSGDWIFRIDSDEVVSAALVAALPALLAQPAVRQYAITRRWLVADGACALDERPWWPDYQVRLTRRATLSAPGRVHEPLPRVEPLVHVIEPLYHFDLLLNDRYRRQEKVIEYEVVHRGGPGTLRGPSVTIYEPEVHADAPPVAVPVEDLASLRRFASAAGLPPVPEPPARMQDVALSASGEDVRVEVLERDVRLVASESRTLTVRVTNLSQETWVSDPAAHSGFFVASRLQQPDGPSVEGPRTALPIPVGPGESAVVTLEVVGPPSEGPASLDVAVVHEFVRWLDPPCRVEINVTPPPPLPLRRSVPRDARTGVQIPRVFHQIWLGGNDLPEIFEEYAETWRHHHPDWTLRLWTDVDAPEIPALARARNLAERADLVRYEVLRRYGGVYLDTDVECLRPIDELLDGVVGFAAYEVPGRVCNAVLGAVPGHPAFARAVHLASIAAGHGTYPEATATTMLTYVLESHDDITLFGPERFYPVLWDGRRMEGEEPPYAVHHWAHSWGDGGAAVA